MRKLFLVLLAMLAVRMAARAVRRGAGDYARVSAALWAVAGQMALAGTANTAKARNIEDRLNILVPRIPVPQAEPGTTAGGVAGGSNTSYSGSNTSYSMGGGTQISYDPAGSSNDGGVSSQTSGQIGGASAHYHSMTHHHTSSGDLQNVVNSTQGSFSNLVPAFNALQGSHSNLVPVVNNLVSDHAQLITDHNNLKAALKASGVLQ